MPRSGCGSLRGHVRRRLPGRFHRLKSSGVLCPARFILSATGKFRMFGLLDRDGISVSSGGFSPCTVTPSLNDFHPIEP